MKPQGDGLRFEGGHAKAALDIRADIRGGRFLDVRGQVLDRTGADRALEVSFTLPVRLAGWQWQNTTARRETIRAGTALPRRRDDFLYLGVKGEQFRNEDHRILGIRTNKLPFSAVVHGEAGLAMALPLDEPRVFLLSASAAGLTVTFSLGLSAAIAKLPSRAGFRFVVFPIDGRWGIRSAADRYHGIFPRIARTRAKRHGNSTVLPNPERPGVTVPEDVEDFGWVYAENDYQAYDGQMSRGSAELARKWGVEVFHWRGPWYWFHEGTPDQTPDEQLALLKAQAEGRAPGCYGHNNQMCGASHREVARAGLNSYLEDDRSKLQRTSYAPPHYGCWLMPGNMDPNLPAPNRYTLAMDWQFGYIRRWDEPGFRGPCNFAWDAFDDWGGFRRLNFRREHLAVMAIPATFDPATGRLCQVKGFTDCAFARENSKRVRAKGGLIMSNVNLEHSMLFGGRFVDVIFRERHPWHYDLERLSVHRMLLGGKPIFFGGGWLPKGRRRWVAQADKLLAFGMAPGTQARRRAELRNLMPVLRKVAEAGYRFIPYATADGLWIERFGDRPGRLYFTVHNPGRAARKSRLSIDLPGLTLAAAGRLAVRDVRSGQPAALERRGDELVGPVSVPAGRTVVLEVQADRQ